jgi:hypothetical protein
VIRRGSPDPVQVRDAPRCPTMGHLNRRRSDNVSRDDSPELHCRSVVSAVLSSIAFRRDICILENN